MEAILGVLLAAKITIRFVDFGAVPERTLSRAEEITRRVLVQAGLQVNWFHCPGPPECRTEPVPGEFRVLLLSRPPAERRGDRLGFAVLPPDSRSRYAGVFYPLVQDAARNLDADPSVVLGAAIAHEIGHLLLGPKHSSSGIMSPDFHEREIRLAARGELLFSREQARRIQLELH